LWPSSSPLESLPPGSFHPLLEPLGPLCQRREEAAQPLAVLSSSTRSSAALAAGTEIAAVTTDLTRLKFRDTNLLDRSYTLSGRVYLFK
jgi:hypothetical protein